jgi:hypothetical protein
MHDMGQDQLRLCYSEFRKHCIQRHDVQEWDTTPHVLAKARWAKKRKEDKK